MRSKKRQWLLSCGLLLVPVLLWNVLLAASLPPVFAAEEFWRDIPGPLAGLENTLRLIVIGLPFLMPLGWNSARERAGLLLFAGGLIVYCVSWLALILAADSGWSRSAAGFLAPAYTPALWLAGITLMGRRLFWASIYRPWQYGLCAALFVAAHLSHAAIVYRRNY